MTQKKRHKSFGSPQSKGLEPITFDLYDEEYTCYPQIQGKHLLEFSRGATSENQHEVTQAILDFFNTALVPESYEQLDRLWNDPARVVPIDTLTDIVSFLIEEYTERPTEASKES